MKPHWVACIFLWGAGATPAWGNDVEFQKRAIAQAREILGVRESLLAHIRANHRDVQIEKAPHTLSFRMPSKTLFMPDNANLSPAGETVVGILRDVANTYRSLYVDLIYEKDAGSDKELKLNTRRGVALGATLFRRWGLAPTQLTLHVVPSGQPMFRLVFHTRKPTFKPTDQDVPFILVHIRDPLPNFSVQPLLPIDVSLISPAGVRKWSLRLIHTKSGTAVKQYRGTSDVWVSVQWNGRDESGKPVPAGEYQAFLTAETYGQGRITDSAGFVVKDPPVALIPPEPRRPTPKPQMPAPARPQPVPAQTAPSPAKETRRWAFIVHFEPNRADITGSAVLEIRQLAASIKMFSNEKVVVEGFADSAEKFARGLAAQRALAVKETLVKEYNVPTNRIAVRDQDPRPALAGETMEKAVTFFVAEDNE
ncbi:MAG: OmpA family protein [Elusimicrobia bacterium]|nr:OmpA family protein [Elusimicrobiota bacterium]